jgi:hypothetical protein
MELNSKYQIPNPKQTPSTNDQNEEKKIPVSLFGSLKFGTWNFSQTLVSAISLSAETMKCDYGIWCLGFEI